MKKLLLTLLILASMLRISLLVYSYKYLYERPYNHRRMSFIYENSQYIHGPKAKLDISDEGLYAFAGYYYVFDKGDVTGVNFENPPLGKYLLGLSIGVFKNEYIISIIYGLLFLIITFQLAKTVFNRYIAVLAVFLLSYSSIFLEQIKTSLIDLPASLFFLIGLYYYVLAQKKYNNRLLYLASFFLAVSFSTKFFPSLIIILAVLAVDSWKKGIKFAKTFFVSLLLIPLVYCLSYLSYFYYHRSLIEFIKFQYWMLKWRSGNPYVFGNIFRLIFTGRYKDWWGWDNNIYVDYNEWNIFTLIVPVLFIASVIYIRKLRSNMTLWIIGLIYLLYVAIGTTGVEKYLLPVYPLYVIFASYVLYSLLSRIYSYVRTYDRTGKS